MQNAPKRFLLIILSFFLSGSNLQAQTDIQHKVFLLGNLTDVKNKTRLTDQLNTLFLEANTPFTLVLNGDLVKEKIGKNDHAEALAPIFSLIDLIREYPDGKLLIVPGDRDWNNSKKDGAKSLEQLEEHIKKYWSGKNDDQYHWAGDRGCPGPEVYEIGEHLVVIAINTQWWNHPYDKVRGSDAACGGLTVHNINEEIEDAIDGNLDKNVLMVGHHPIFSLGNYGGYFSVADQLKPLPILGSFRTAFHANAGSPLDLANPRLHVYIENMRNVFHFHDNLIYATGHEKNQQIVTFGKNYMVNSGAPETAKFAAQDDNTIYSAKESGIMELAYYEDGKVATTLWKYTADEDMHAIANHTLFQSLCGNQLEGDIPTNSSYVPCRIKVEATPNMQYEYSDVVQVIAGAEYEAGWWKEAWFGKHYRTSWMAPVTTSYLNLDTTFGGLTIYKKGGGRQTTSLKFKSANGTQYTFRSVNKDPIKALNYHLRNTFAADVIRDQTSSQHPYGAMAVAALLDQVDILHVNPVLYRLPDDPKLGYFKTKYGDLLGMLEESPSKKNKEGVVFGDAKKIHKSSQLYRRFYRRQYTKINQEEFTRARIFDMLIGDWSKHEDNWKWAAYDEDGFRTYRPIPRDRDHAFSRQDGIINWIADRPFGVPNLQNFGEDFVGIRSLTFQARHMDRFMLDEVPKSVFLAQAKYIQDNITKADIEAAVRNMPAETYEKSGRIIEKKLKNRIQHLDEAAEEYYGLLSKEVDVLGSNEEEYFLVEYKADGSLLVQVFDTSGDKKGKIVLYDRAFYPQETKEVRLWGLGDDDIFDISGTSDKIRLRAFGGTGDDTFLDKALAKSLLYDKGKETVYHLNGSAKVINHWNTELYEYDRMRFGYNHAIPVISMGYSTAMGFGVNLGYKFTVRKFTKDDYHSTHSVVLGTTTEGNHSAAYTGRFHQAIREWDVLVDASVNNASIRNRFFGLGNDTQNKEDELGLDYFQPVVSSSRISLGLERIFWKKSAFTLKAGIEQNESKEVRNTFLSDNFQTIYGAHQKIAIVPVKILLDLDFRDKGGLPYRGARALFSYQNNSVLDAVDGSRNFGIASGEIEYYLSTLNRHPLTLGFRVGGATSHGNVPWYKLPLLGSSHGLRGYVDERFVGDSNAFINTELRFQILKRNTSIVPIKAGIKVFFDYGRVFQSNLEESKDWRYGYGIGFYLVPLDEAITVSLSVGFSDEETFYPKFSIGTPLR